MYTFCWYLQKYHRDSAVKGSSQLIPNIIDALDLAGKLPLALKENAIGPPSHEVNIDPTQSGGLLAKFDAMISGTGTVVGAEGAGGVEGSAGVQAVGGADRQRGVEMKGTRICFVELSCW
jgi:hypothetical protein